MDRPLFDVQVETCEDQVETFWEGGKNPTNVDPTDTARISGEVVGKVGGEKKPSQRNSTVLFCLTNPGKRTRIRVICHSVYLVCAAGHTRIPKDGWSLPRHVDAGSKSRQWGQAETAPPAEAVTRFERYP